MKTLTLVTADGHEVAELQEPVVGLMTADGMPPEVVVWGERFFAHECEMRYREVLCVVVGLYASSPDTETTP